MSPETLNSGQNRPFSVLCDLEIWWMTLKNNRAPLLCYFQFVHHFKAISEFKTELLSGNSQFGSKSTIFFYQCDLEIWQMTLKKIRHLSQPTSSFVHHFAAIGEFKLELWSGNGQIGSKLANFLPMWPKKIDRWPRKTIGYLSYATSSFLHHFTVIC